MLQHMRDWFLDITYFYVYFTFLRVAIIFIVEVDLGACDNASKTIATKQSRKLKRLSHV